MKGISRKLKKAIAFSLAEVLIVIAIMSVLGGFGAVEVTKYQRSLEQIEYDSTAKEIFIAAQNHLSMVEGQGYLGKTEFGTSEQSNIYYYVVNAGSLRSSGSENNPDNTNSVLNLMLPFASIDDSARTGGSYIIRYQKEPAQVLDVFYSDSSDDKFGYSFSADDYSTFMGTPSNESSNATAVNSNTASGNIKPLTNGLRGDDKKEERKNYSKKVIGYYGGVDATEIPTVSKLNVPTIEIINDEVLAVVVKNHIANTGSSLKLVVTGLTSKVSKEFKLIDTDASTGGDTFTIVLDDITTDGKTFKKICCSDDDASKNLTPGENISVKAIAYSKSAYTNIAESVEKQTNSLFAGLTTESAAKTAQIASFRHLQNLKASVSGIGNTVVTNAVQTTNLDWKNRSTALAGYTLGSKAYVPVSPDYTLSYDGQNYSVSSLAASVASDAGMFGSVSGGTIENIELIDFSIASTDGNAGALAGSISGTTVEGVFVHNSKSDDGTKEISASEAAGGLVGHMTGGTISCSAASVYVKAAGPAGGLVGKVSGSATIGNSYSGGHTKTGKYLDTTAGAARINVISTGTGTAASYAGGLVGDANSGSAITISYCYSTCSVKGAAAGGFIGVEATGSIKHSYSTGKVFSYGNKVGQFVGSHGSVGYEDCKYLSNVSDNTISTIITGIAGVSGKDTSNSMIRYPGTAEKSPAWATSYDSSLVSSFKGKYYFPTIKMLNTEVDSSSMPWLNRHYGDWQVAGFEPLTAALNNKDTLNLELELEDDTKTVALSVTGEYSKVTRIFEFEVSDDRKSLVLKKKGLLTGGETSCVMETADGDELPIGAITSNKVQITFDDITKPNCHFNDIFCSDSVAGNNMVPGENIAVRVGSGSASWTELSALDEDDVKKENSLFARSNDASGIGTANIKYIRHLQNLDQLISSVDDSVATAVMQGDIYWNDSVYGKIYNADSSASVTKTFQGIYNANLTSFDGNNKSINNLKIDGTQEDITSGEIGSGNAGLFRYVNTVMTVTRVKLNNFNVNADSGNAGALVAETAGSNTFTVDTVLATSDTNKGTISRFIQSDSGIAGGLIGKSASPLDLDNSAASVYVKAGAQAGGLIGLMNSGSVTNAYAGGHTINNGENCSFDITSGNFNITSTGSTAGGLIGQINGSTSIENCFSVASVEAAATSASKAAGGFIGTVNANVSIDTAYVIAPVYKVRITKDGSSTYAGAFVGTITGSNMITNESLYYLPEVYDGNEADADGNTYVEFTGVGSASGIRTASEVKLAYYENDGELNVVAGIRGNMQKRTYVHDSVLKRDDIKGTREYPFAIWTLFAFDNNSLPSYYGDWQPTLNPATVMLNVTFKYEDPTKSPVTVHDFSGYLAQQEIHKDEDNYVVTPLAPSYAGYSLLHWEMEYDDPGDDTTASFEENARHITIPRNYAVKDMTLTARYEKEETKCTVTFYYDPTGANENFTKITSQKVDPDTPVNSLYVPSRDVIDHVLVGWYYDPDFTQKVDFTSTSTQTVTTNLNIYAQYEEITYFTITVDFQYKNATGDLSPISTVQQYFIQHINGLTFDEDVALPTTLSAMTPSEIMYYTDSGLVAAPSTMASVEPGGKKIHLTIDEETSIVVVYTGTMPGDYQKYQIFARYMNTDASGNYHATQTKTELLSEGFAPIGFTPSIVPDEESGYKKPGTKNVYSYGSSKIEAIVENPSGGIANTNKIYIDYYRKSYMVTFNTNGGSFIQSQVLNYGETLVAPDQPVKSGSTFANWVLEVKNTGESTSWGSPMPASNVTVTVNWNPGPANFLIMAWFENADDYNYTYMGSITRTRTAGQSASSSEFVNDAKNVYTESDKNQFEHNSAKDETIIVSSDGTSILNVYFTRKTYTLNFKATDVCGLDSHTHTDSCYENVCGKAEHTAHTAECLICSIPAHTHVNACCGKEEHKHIVSCYNNVKSDETDRPNGRLSSFPRDYEEGVVYDYSYISGLSIKHKYFVKLDGKWHELRSGSTLSVKCTKMVHSHGDGTCTYICGKMPHTHGASCYKDELHTHSAGCRVLTCTISGHVHSSTCNSTRSTNTIFSVTAKYGSDITWCFPIQNQNNPSKNYAGTKWQANRYFDITLVSLDRMPPANIDFSFNTGGTNETIYYYVEALPGDTGTITETISGHTYTFKLHKTVPHGFRYLTPKEEFHNIEGFTQYAYKQGERGTIRLAAGNIDLNSSSQQINIGSDNKNYFYYLRSSYDVEFYVDKVKVNTVEKQHGVSLAEYESYNPTSAPAPGYTFSGWHEDIGCTVDYNFSTKKMPMGNLLLFGEWLPPSYTVDMYLDDPSVVSDATLLARFDDVLLNTSIKIADEYGRLYPAYNPTRVGYDFAGWFYKDSGGSDQSFNYSMGIQGDMTVFAKWEPQIVAKTADVLIHYVKINGEQLKADRYLTDCRVGDTLQVPADIILGWTPQLTVQYINVVEDDENLDLNEVTFTYKEADSWRYNVEYYLRFKSYTTGETELGTLEITDGSASYLISSTPVDTYNQYESVLFHLPEDYDNYHFCGYDCYYGTGAGATYNITNGMTMMASVHPNADGESQTPTIRFYMEPDPTTVSVPDRYVTYDGNSQALKTVLGATESYGVPVTGVGVTTDYVYCYYTGSKNSETGDYEPLTSEQVIDAGSYRMNGYVMINITGTAVGESSETTKHFLLWKDTSKSLNLIVAARPIIIKSASDEWEYDGNEHTRRDNTMIDANNFTDITIQGPEDPANPGTYLPGFITREGAAEAEGAVYTFSVDSFRLQVGEQENQFTHRFKSNTKASNYSVTKVYGILKVVDAD